METGGRETVFAVPRHPYTAQLMRSIPQLNAERGMRLPVIPGNAAAPGDVPVGCAFAPRCEFAEEHCTLEAPPLTEVVPGQQAACWVTADGETLPLQMLLAEPPAQHVSVMASRARAIGDARAEPEDAGSGPDGGVHPESRGREIIVATDVHISYGVGRRHDGKGLDVSRCRPR
jgi:oligopeptide/dipeptide ABC transporter ATP-binding protein